MEMVGFTYTGRIRTSFSGDVKKSGTQKENKIQIRKNFSNILCCLSNEEKTQN